MKFLIALLCLSSFGADHYIRVGATGTGDGSSWTNAWTAIAGRTWVRGDTYYIASGTYTGNVSLTSAVSGTTRVTIRKATAAAHGTETGWNASYATGQAIIAGSFTLYHGYVTIDGVTGSGRSGHGIKIIHTTGGNGSAIFETDSQVPSLEVLHLEIEGPGMGAQNGVSAFKQNNLSTPVKGHRFQDVWAHDISQNGLVFVNVAGTSYSDYGLLLDGVVIDNSGYNITGGHGQGIQCGSGSGASTHSYWIIRNSIFHNITGTADLACLGYSTNDHFLIYNNLFYNDNLSFDENGNWIDWVTLKDASSPGVIYFSSTSSSATSIGIYNNTFYRISRNTIYFGGTNTDTSVKNNLFLSGHFNQIHEGVTTSTNNDYWDCLPIISSGIYGCPYNETGQQGESASPVVNASAADFRLNAGVNAIGNGENLSSLFTTDFAGVSRGSTWDIGAYEYAAPPPPTTFRGVMRGGQIK